MLTLTLKLQSFHHPLTLTLLAVQFPTHTAAGCTERLPRPTL